MRTTTVCNKDGSFDIYDIDTRKLVKHIPKSNQLDIDDDSCRNASHSAVCIIKLSYSNK